MTDKAVVLFILTKYYEHHGNFSVVYLVEKYTNIGKNIYLETPLFTPKRGYFIELVNAIRKMIVIYGDFINGRPIKRNLSFYKETIKNPKTFQFIMKDINEFRVKKWYWKKLSIINEKR